jgi:hypothetical protein
VNVVVVIDAEFIAALKVAVTVELTATAVAALAGVVEVTVGGTGGGGGGVLDPPHPARTNEIARQRALTRITTLFRSFGRQGLRIGNRKVLVKSMPLFDGDDPSSYLSLSRDI